MKKPLIAIVGIAIMLLSFTACQPRYVVVPFPGGGTSGETVLTDAEKTEEVSKAIADSVNTNYLNGNTDLGESSSTNISMPIGDEVFTGTVETNIQKDGILALATINLLAENEEPAAESYVLTIRANLSSVAGNKIVISAVYNITTDGATTQSDFSAEFNDNPVEISNSVFNAPAEIIANRLRATQEVADIANAFSKEKIISEFQNVVSKATEGFSSKPIETDSGLIVTLGDIIVNGESSTILGLASIKDHADIPVSVTFNLSSDSYSACFQEGKNHQISGGIDVTISGVSAIDDQRGTIINVNSLSIVPADTVSVDGNSLGFEKFTMPIEFIADPKLLDSPHIQLPDFDKVELNVPAKNCGLMFTYDGISVAYSDVYERLDSGTSFPE